MAIFQSGANERSAAACSELARGMPARKRAHHVEVRFVDQQTAVHTLEGVVHANPGDAIVTGPSDEHWPVARDAFAGKYQAVPPLVMGEAGSYLSLPVEVLAVPMHAPFVVVLADRHSQLSGQAGDWLLDYRDGSLGIVSATIFAATYELLEPR